MGLNDTRNDVEFLRSDHPIFRVSSAFERGEQRSKGGDRKSVHFNGSDENIEFLLRTVISADQLSVYRAVADLCNELSEDFWASEKLAAPEHFEMVEIPTVLSHEFPFHCGHRAFSA